MENYYPCGKTTAKLIRTTTLYYLHGERNGVIGGTKLENKVIEESIIVLHPERLKLYKALKESGKPLFINELAEKLGTERRLVSYHLSTLEQHGFVKSEFKVIQLPHSKGKAGRFYQLTEKADNLIPKLIAALKE